MTNDLLLSIVSGSSVVLIVLDPNVDFDTDDPSW